MLTTNRQIEALQKRADHLQKRINENKNNSFDRTELAALSNAIIDLRQILSVPGLELIVEQFNSPAAAAKKAASIRELIGEISSFYNVNETFQSKSVDLRENLAIVCAATCLEIIRRVREEGANVA